MRLLATFCFDCVSFSKRFLSLLVPPHLAIIVVNISRPWINDEEPPSGNWLLTEGCLSSWALPGRKSRRLPEPDYVSLLGFVLPQLLRRLHKSSGDVAELIGAVSAEALLLGEVSPALGDSTLAIGTELHGSLVLNGSESDLAAHDLLSMSSHITTGEPPLGDADAHASSQKSPCLVPPRSDVEPLGAKLSDIKETENMRRSEVLQLSVQVFATLQLCTSLGALPLPALPLESYRVLGALAEMVGHQLRPRRGHEDPMAEKWCMGPQRLEAFVRRPEEPMQEEVFKTTRALMPFLPDTLGWAEWDEDPNRRFARLHGEPGGAESVSHEQWNHVLVTRRDATRVTSNAASSNSCVVQSGRHRQSMPPENCGM